MGLGTPRVRGADGAEVIYALRNSSTLANLILENLGQEGEEINNAYQRRLPSDTSKDYYFIHRDTGVTEPVIIEYDLQTNLLNNEASIKSTLENYASAVVRAVATYIGKNIISSSTYTVQKGDSLWSIANRFNTTVDELKRLNKLTSDALRVGQILIIPKSEGEIEAPTGFYIVQKGDSLWSIANKFDTTVEKLKSLNNLKDNILNIGQQLVVPGKQTETNTYMVQRGDSLWSIAKKLNTTVEELKRINNLTSNSLSIGQILKIPVMQETPPSTSLTTYTVQRGDSLYTIAKKYGTTVEKLMQINNLTTNLLDIGQVLYVPEAASQNTYTVQKGDSLWSIANKFNTTVNEIKKKNNLTTNSISIGQKLII